MRNFFFERGPINFSSFPYRTLTILLMVADYSWRPNRPRRGWEPLFHSPFFFPAKATCACHSFFFGHSKWGTVLRDGAVKPPSTSPILSLIIRLSDSIPISSPPHPSTVTLPNFLLLPVSLRRARGIRRAVAAAARGSDGRKRGTAVGGVWRLRRLEPLLSPRGRSSSLRAATSRRSRERGLASRGFSCSAAHAPSPEGRRRGVPGDALGAGKLDAGGRSLRLALASCPRRPLPITSSPPGSSKKEEMKLVN